jgi:hypothetical protein
MSACAGSSTDASRSLWSRCSQKDWLLRSSEAIMGSVRIAREEISSISPAWSRWIAPGRIGFMSTQRWEDHLRLAHCKDRAGSLGDRFPCSPARHFPAMAAGRTAPPEVPAKSATNSLPSDHRNKQPVRLVFFDVRVGSAPLGKASIQRLKLERPPGYPRIPSFADHARSHATLPRVPAALSCRTERYDGKRDLHLQHAA